MPSGALLRALRSALRGRRSELRARFGGAEFDGYVFPLIVERGEIAGAVAAGLDASAFSRTERELIEVREALRHAQGVTSFAYYVVDLPTGVVTVSEPFAQIWGLPPGTMQIAYSDLLQRVHDEDRDAFDALRTHALESSPSLALQCRIVRPSGEIRYIRTFGSIFTGANGKPERSVGSVFDFTDHMQAQNAVLFLSTHDPAHRIAQSPSAARSARPLFRERPHRRARDLRYRSLRADQRDRGTRGRRSTLCVRSRIACAFSRSMDIMSRVWDRTNSHVCWSNRKIARSWRPRRTVTRRARRAVQSGTRRVCLAHNDGSGRSPARRRRRTTTPKCRNGAVCRQNGGARWSGAIWPGARAQNERAQPAGARPARRDRTQRIRDVLSAADRCLEQCASSRRKRCYAGSIPNSGYSRPTFFSNIAEESDAVVEIGRWAIDRACRDAILIRDSLGRDVRLNVNVSPRHVQSSELVGHVSSAR